MKQFDAVRMMREIRDRMAERYSKDPQLEMKELDETRKKYGMVEPRQKVRSRSASSAPD